VVESFAAKLHAGFLVADCKGNWVTSAKYSC